MKILYYGKFRRDWDTESYISRALVRAGHEVRILNQDKVLHDRIPRTLDKMGGADALLTAKPNMGIVDQNSLAEIRPRCRCTVSWSFDLVHHSFRWRRWRWAKAISSGFDIFACSDGYSVREMGRGVVLRQGIGDDVRAGSVRSDFACDVLFLGSAYGDRGALVEKLAGRYGLKFRIATHVRGAALSDLMASSKVVVGPLYPSMPGYFSNRVYVVLGYGGCFVAPTIEGMTEEDGLLPGVHYEPYDPASDESLFEAIDRLLKDPARQQKIRTAGQQYVLRNLTYDHRAKTLVKLIEEKIAEKK